MEEAIEQDIVDESAEWVISAAIVPKIGLMFDGYKASKVEFQSTEN